MYGERLPCGNFLRRLERLIKWCTAAIPSVLTAMTLVRAYLCKIALLAVKQNTVDLLKVSALL